MRATKAGWRPRDLDRLYTGYGFEREEGQKHTIYRHPVHKELWTTVTRSVPMSKAYAEEAVRLIDELTQLESTGGDA